MKRSKLRLLQIGVIAFLMAFFAKPKPAYGIFGEDIPFLIQLIAHAIHQISQLQSIIGNGKEMVGLLNEMNDGVKQVLLLGETAHAPLPPQTLSEARQIDGAMRRASAMYGVLPGDSPFYARSQYQSGVEGLHLSQDAFDYATFLDRQGGQVKSAAVGSSMATATRLTAESLGVLLHAVSHQSRLQAKQLEIQSTQNIE